MGIDVFGSGAVGDLFKTVLGYNQYDYVYYNGDSYTALAANTNITPGTDGGITWQLFRLPSYMTSGVVTYAYALALEEDGQTDKAQQQYNKAQGQLVREYDKQETQQGLGSTFSVRVV